MQYRESAPRFQMQPRKCHKAVEKWMRVAQARLFTRNTILKKKTRNDNNKDRKATNGKENRTEHQTKTKQKQQKRTSTTPKQQRPKKNQQQKQNGANVQRLRLSESPKGKKLRIVAQTTIHPTTTPHPHPHQPTPTSIPPTLKSKRREVHHDAQGAKDWSGEDIHIIAHPNKSDEGATNQKKITPSHLCSKQ
jgi:hypothetical protein